MTNRILHNFHMLSHLTLLERCIPNAAAVDECVWTGGKTSAELFIFGHLDCCCYRCCCELRCDVVFAAKQSTARENFRTTLLSVGFPPPDDVAIISLPLTVWTAWSQAGMNVSVVLKAIHRMMVFVYIISQFIFSHYDIVAHSRPFRRLLWLGCHTVEAL